MLYSAFPAALLLVGLYDPFCCAKHVCIPLCILLYVLHYTFSNFCETFSSNSPLCSVASAIVSPFFMILHNFPLKWTSRPFQLVSLRKLDFHIAEVHRAHHI